MPRLHVRFAALFTVAGSLAGAIIAACSGGDSSPGEPTVCDPAQCGTQLDLAKGKCDDGTASGPTGRCIQTAASTCGWEVKTCGGACTASETSCPDGTKKTGTCVTDPTGACACTNPCDCSATECGPDPYAAPAETCADGHIGGSYCARSAASGDAAGTCSWVLKPPCPSDGGDAGDASDTKPPPVDTGSDGTTTCTLTLGTCPIGCFPIDAEKVDGVKKCWSGVQRIGCTAAGDTGDATVTYFCGVDASSGQIFAIPGHDPSEIPTLRACNPGEKTIFDAAEFTDCTPADAGTDTTAPPDTAPDAPYGDASACGFDAVIQPLFSTNCAVTGCHTGTTPTGNMNLSVGFAYAYIVEVASIEVPSLKRVKRFDPDHSYLYMKITGAPASGTSPMPPPATGTVLTAAQKDAIRCWIAAGAPP
jgi:hypothetical protein